MHLIEVLALRPVPAAGLFMGLTRRCPLSCAHCSTNSMLTSEEHPEEPFLRFVESFRADDRPELLLMSGGEPLLRPGLVGRLARSARSVGCRSLLLSGMFFARSGRAIPKPIKRAIDELDHFSASLDVFHEREVTRSDVFRVLRQLLDEGKDVSLQVVGLGASDPYLAEITEDVRRSLNDRVPILVGTVGPIGRAASWLKLEAQAGPARPDVDPCTLAAWPLVSYDGTIVACCNQHVADGRAAPHLHLGHAATDEWPAIRARPLTSPMLRPIRTFGPEYLADRHGSGVVSCDGYCSTCMKLQLDPELEARVADLFERPGMKVVEAEVRDMQIRAGALSYARRFGISRYADLVALGATEVAEAR